MDKPADATKKSTEFFINPTREILKTFGQGAATFNKKLTKENSQLYSSLSKKDHDNLKFSSADDWKETQRKLQDQETAKRNKKSLDGQQLNDQILNTDPSTEEGAALIQSPKRDLRKMKKQLPPVICKNPRGKIELFSHSSKHSSSIEERVWSKEKVKKEQSINSKEKFNSAVRGSQSQSRDSSVSESVRQSRIGSVSKILKKKPIEIYQDTHPDEQKTAHIPLKSAISSPQNRRDPPSPTCKSPTCKSPLSKPVITFGINDKKPSHESHLGGSSRLESGWNLNLSKNSSSNIEPVKPTPRRGSLLHLFKTFGSNKVTPFPAGSKAKIEDDKATEAMIEKKLISEKSKGTVSFGVISLVSQAIKRFKNSIRFRKIENLKSHQIVIINDWAWFRNNDQEDEEEEYDGRSLPLLINFILKILLLIGRLIKTIGCFVRIGEALSILAGKVSVFNPKSRSKLAWDLFMMFLIFWNFFNISVAITFNEGIEDVFLLNRTDHPHTEYYFFVVFSFIFMMIDIFITLNTSYYEAGALVGSRRRIFKNYLKQNLLIDILAEVPFFFQIISYHTEMEPAVVKNINILFFLKYYNFRGVFKVLEEFLSLDEKNESFFLLLQLFAKIFFVAHILGCLWHSVGYMNAHPGGKSWLNKLCLNTDEVWTERYIYSVYFALTTMTTVGYGDVSPQNQLEVLMAMLTMLIGSAMFGYGINNIGELLKKMNHKEDQLKNEIRSLDRYMKSKNVNYELQVRARKYLEYVWNEERLLEGNEDELLSKLSKSIKNEILLESHGSILENYPMLKKNFSSKSMLRLINVIKTVRYSPEEIIFEEMECPADPNLYLISHGEIELLVNTQRRNEKSISLKVLKVGESFGEISFFTCFPQDFTARSLNYSTVYIIKRSEFISAIKDNADDWENFCMIKDRFMLYGELDDLYLRCYSCGDKHLLRKCPALKYLPSKYKTVMKYQNTKKKKSEFRRTLSRDRKLKKFNTLVERKVVARKCSPFAKGKSQIEEEEEEEENASHLADGNMIKSATNVNPQANQIVINECVSKNQKTDEAAEKPARPVPKSPLLQKKGSMHLSQEHKGEVPVQAQSSKLSLSRFASSTNLAVPLKEIDTEAKTEETAAVKKDQADPFEIKNEIFMMSFENFKNYINYFPKNNPRQVVLKMQVKNRRNNLFSRNPRLASILNFIRGNKRNEELVSPINEFSSPQHKRK